MASINSGTQGLRFLGALGLAGLLASAVQVEAADHPMPESCQADVGKYCPGLTPGDGKLGPCLREHHEQFSPECKQALRAMRQAHRPQRPASGSN